MQTLLISKRLSTAFTKTVVYSLALQNPPKVVSIIKLFYGDIRSKVICGQNTMEDFKIKIESNKDAYYPPSSSVLGSTRS